MSTWVCTHCGKTVELVPPGAWWRHLSLEDQQTCGIRLSDDAYNTDTDEYYVND